MPAQAVVIGVDSSTQSTKAVLADAATGRTLAVGRAAHEVSGEAGARETDPELWWRALCDAVAQALKESGVRPSAVTGIAVAGQQHGLVVLDAQGRPVRPALLWNDTRSAPQAAALARELPGGAREWAERTGSAPVAALTAAKWRLLTEREPRAAAAVAAVRLPHDYLTEKLSGVAATDPGDASGTGWYATATGGYDPELLGLLGLDARLLPEVAPTGGTRIGSLRPAAAEALGLPAGIAVAAGTGDNMAAAVGLGLGGTGLLDHPVLSLGTSGTVYAATRARPVTPALSGFAATDGTYLPLACTLNCTLAVDRIAALLGLGRDAAESGRGVVLLPYLDGERTPDLPGAAGLLTGLRHTTTRQQILGAAYEGAVVTVLRALDEVLTACGLDPAAPGPASLPLRLIGGGARGRYWVETVRRLSGRPLVIPADADLTALGAAALAAAAATGADPVTVARTWSTGSPPPAELPALDRDTETWARVSSEIDTLTRDEGTTATG
ncbi:xylulokinase [Streptomyces tsukubensis]|uniref:Xylulose kinase n=3 Tax=Streptomyces TaxID=1883 RepID=A0A7G3U816_STRT9|nr:xylulokinase [Streptomyces tsukubensis]AZK97511.1 xylulokinase [Streptomyces tsukubensis]QKM66543.1 xylulokinase [Streptomyces tsukubensis NRRL18488]TAI45115.1 xylulokinase [Streptomyces tsukubensis]